jgi:glycosyltransferase involved in cell wall biosynthesis
VTESERPLRILIVTQFWPGPSDPDLGVFVYQLADELRRRGNEVDQVFVDHRGGSRTKHARLGAAAVRAALRMRPDVIYAHFLAPAGALAAVASVVARVPLVVTAHGQDVRNLGAIPGVRAVTKRTVARASAVIPVSDYLRRELVAQVPAAAEKAEVINCGVDLERFQGGDGLAARERLGWKGDGPHFLFVGTLDERKNVVRLRDAFESLDGGQLAYVGVGPLRAELEGRPNIRVVGAVPFDQVPDWMTACDVLCLPSHAEAFGQVLIEAMASERSVLAGNAGGPPEFVPPQAGVLVDPASVESIADGMRAALRLPSPNAAAREVAREHDLRRQAERIERVLRRAAQRGRRGEQQRA